MLKRVFFLLVFPLIVFATETFSTGERPAWCQLFDYELSPQEIKPSQVNTQYLLIDVQRNWEEKTVYRRIAVKPLTQAGIEEVAHWNLRCNPAFEKTVVHSIRIYRNGTWHDRLESARHHVLQREDSLDSKMYTGLLTLIYFINDIRIGDVVEYQYSYQGGNPLFTTHLDDVAYLEHPTSVEQVSYRLVAHPSRDFWFKPFYTNQTMHVQDLSPELREWSIKVAQTEPRPTEKNQPSWFNPLARIQINEYHTWKIVIDKMAPLVALPEAFIYKTPEEIQNLVTDWMIASNDPYERARLATRFIQNEIHYLSLSDGISALKPEDPVVIFMRRFGDCKDKTLLLHGLLKLMNIRSTPVLVHSTLGARLPHALPSPHLFNHMILRIEFEEETLFVDPTLSLQGGPLASNYFPDYSFGLPLSHDNYHLISLPTPWQYKPTQIETTFKLLDPKSIEMDVVTDYFGHKADAIRRKLYHRGLKKLSESHLSYTQALYRGASTLIPLHVSDDAESNHVQTSEHYLLPLRSKKGRKYFKLESQTLADYLISELDPNRKAPYELPFPVWIQEHIHVDNLLETENVSSEEMHYDHDSFVFRSTYQRQGQEADFTFELKFLKDYILPSQIPALNEILSKIESHIDLEVEFSAEKKDRD